MRSSVSYMLSQGSGEPIMSHPDYEQNAHHHGALLVLVRGIGPAKPRSLQKVFERIQRVQTMRIPDSAGLPRDIWVRYIRDHPVENNDWGDFQTHRRLLGLVTVGKFDTQTELNELCRIHESLKVKYTSTLYDSRCLLFGPTVAPPAEVIPEGDGEPVDDEVSANGKASGSPMTSKKLQDLFTPPPNFKSRAFFYPENDVCANLESAMAEFISALFWVLESKRLERSREKIDKVALLLAPFEKRDFVGLDLESRNNRKRCMGRVTKNLADLTLQAGLVAESLTLFHAASETLRAISDSLWLGAANEGLCAASAILLYPHMRQPQPLQRNASLQEAGSPQRRVASKSSSAAKKAAGIVQSNAEADSGVVKSTCSSLSSSSSESSTSSLTSSISPGVTTGSSSSVSSIVAPPGSMEDSPVAPFPPNILSPEDITARYRDAIINYSKYRHAGIIETEAALKAARICIEQGQNLDVSMFLQNVLYINLNMSEQERVQRFETLTGLYEKIGYHRKASFCQRLAAWRHVAASNANPDFAASYRLMLDSFPGHKMSLDPLEMLSQDSGWKCLQVDLLQQLVMAAKKMDNAAVAVRHLTYMIQTMWPSLSPAEQNEVATHLQNLAAQCEGAPVPLVLDSGRVLPPANLTDLPFCCQLQVRELPPALRPHKIATNKVDSGPFLFTPIHFTSATGGGQHRGSAGGGSGGSGSASAQPVQWVQHDVGEVALKLKNPLPGELHVCDMRLLSTGVVLESRPQTISLVASPVATSVTLQGTPLEVGTLEILGYSTHTLGVKSNCRLRDMQRSRQHLPTSVNVEVIPALPTLSVTTSLAEKGMTLYNGEEAEIIVTLTNTGSVPIEFLEGAIHSQLDLAAQARIFHWVTPEEMNQALPIAPQASATFTLRIFGDADFLGPVNLSLLSAGVGLSPPQVVHEGPQSLSVGSTSLMTVTSGPSNHSRVSSPTHRRNTELTSSFRSTHSGHSSLATVSLNTATMGTAARHMEAQLRLRFSGGAGYQEGFCRQVSASLPLELLPSAHITNWDVLPAETPSQFYLVLDVVNVTGQEMALQYTEQKNIVIEAKESCRIPVPVERCPLEKIQGGMISESISVLSGHEADQIEKICSGHIADQVNLRWSLVGTETKGLASLKGITLSPVMLDLVTVAPLQWEITIDREKVSSTAEISKMTGECVTLGVSIINLSPQPLHRLIISIQFYQDYQNGMHNYRLETRIIMSGTNEILIPFLGRSERASHECSVIFFTPGRFKADIQCSAQNSHMVSISSHAAESTSSGGGASSVVTGPTSMSGHRHADAHIWRFTPPIEVTVVE
ncbi:protein brunelleschi [Phlebotomus argentipes]|uniref:protein brunelleschi n=1 Tax=Phlebotomus argentipes TaxID=94469 RepID=UPI0028933856|nr:protein brunelleschi [Phlebotomus argentipes]